MSTIDPQAVKAERARQAQGSAGALVWAILGALAVLAGGFFFGLGLISVGGAFRDMSINPVDDWATGLPECFWAFFVGLFGGVHASLVYCSGARRFTGRTRPAVGPFCLLMAGAAVGSLVGASSLPAVRSVGRTTSFGTTEAWGPFAWFWYYEPTWLPALLTVLAVVGLFGSITAARRSRATWARTYKLIRNGVERPGQVSDVQFTTARINGKPKVRFTVAYTDAEGIDRWVTKTAVFDELKVPRTGQPVTVWYDPDRPDDQLSILVTLAPAEAARRATQDADAQYPADDDAASPAWGAADSASPAWGAAAETPVWGAADSGTPDWGAAKWGAAKWSAPSAKSTTVRSSTTVSVNGGPAIPLHGPIDLSPEGIDDLIARAHAAAGGGAMSDAAGGGAAGAVQRRASARVLTVNERPTSIAGELAVQLQLGVQVTPEDGSGSFMSNISLTVANGSIRLPALRQIGATIPVFYVPGEFGTVMIDPTYLAGLGGR